MSKERRKEKPQKTLAHYLLGEEQIKKICDSFGLDDKGKEIVDRILTRWAGSPETPAKKIAIIMEEAGDSISIHSTLLAITNQFSQQVEIMKQNAPRFGKEAQKAPYN